LAATIGWLLVLGAGISLGMWMWPEGDMAWWRYGLRSLAAIGVGAAGGLLIWLAVLPLLMGLAMEHLARAVLREHGVAVAEERLVESVLSSARVIGSTLGMRFGWLLVGVVGGFIAGPFGVPVAAYAMSYVAVFDALDVALAARGWSGKRRLAAIRANVPLATPALSAGALSVLLGLTILLWPFWLPALVTGAALSVRAWEGGDPPQPRPA